MRDLLMDLVAHTSDLGGIDLIKVAGTDKETVITALAEDRSVVVDAQFINPSPDFVGTFGMPNLSKLKILLNLEAYKENAKIAIKQRKDGAGPESLDFSNADGDFHNNYRFMSMEIVNEKFMISIWY